MTEQRPRFATISNPTIEATVNSLFRFQTKEQALKRLESIKSHFITSKNQIENDEEPSIILWVKGFEITDEEHKQGFLGNYAVISYKKTPDDKFTLYGAKIETELKYHPQRKRQQHKHPNWGHPVLRAIKKKKIYASVEEARQELLTLHEEYPDTSIPLTNKLYIIIYSKALKKTPPVQKYVFEIKVAEDEENGGFYIHYEENEYKAPPATPKKEESVEPPKGYFTSMIELRRKPKKPAPKSDS